MSHFGEPTKEALDNIKKFNNTLNQYANLQPGESKQWYFDPNSVEKVVNRFNQDRIRFKVYDPDMDADFIWDSPFGAARQVVAFLEKKVYFLKIQRQGEGKETRYAVNPAGATTQEMEEEDSS